MQRVNFEVNATILTLPDHWKEGTAQSKGIIHSHKAQPGHTTALVSASLINDFR